MMVLKEKIFAIDLKAQQCIQKRSVKNVGRECFVLEDVWQMHIIKVEISMAFTNLDANFLRKDLNVLLGYK